MKPNVEIYDTTLRDGSQGEGVNFSVADKLRIAERIDAFGIQYIEGGWPGSNPKDIEFFIEARKRKFKNARLAAFGSTRRKGVPVEQDEQVRLLLEAETPVVTIYGKTWLLHVTQVLKTTPNENLEMISDTIRYLKEHDKFVVYDCEHGFDGYKDDAEYALATFKAAEKAGADIVVLCDTNGGCLPGDIRRITAAARENLKCRLGIHTHDDIGLGVANALAALEVGASHVQGTINGYGERTGNCNLTSVIPNVALKLGLTCVPDRSLVMLQDLSQYVDEIANIRHNPRQPWVGSAAFSHKGGTHVNAVQKLASSYEHVDPSKVGNSRRVLVSDLAGRSNIVLKAQELGFKVHNDTPELRDILSQIKDLEHQGYEFEAAEASLFILIRKVLKHQEPPFRVEAYHVSMRREGVSSVCEATVKIRVDGKLAHKVAEGDGPVNALDSALRRALLEFFPEKLKKVVLTDYKVRILDVAPGVTESFRRLRKTKSPQTRAAAEADHVANADGNMRGTAAKTRVLIQSSDGNKEWGTVGVSENIIEASLQALVDSMEYALSRKGS